MDFSLLCFMLVFCLKQACLLRPHEALGYDPAMGRLNVRVYLGSGPRGSAGCSRYRCPELGKLSRRGLPHPG